MCCELQMLPSYPCQCSFSNMNQSKILSFRSNSNISVVHICSQDKRLGLIPEISTKVLDSVMLLLRKPFEYLLINKSSTSSPPLKNVAIIPKIVIRALENLILLSATQNVLFLGLISTVPCFISKSHLNTAIVKITKPTLVSNRFISTLKLLT